MCVCVKGEGVEKAFAHARTYYFAPHSRAPALTLSLSLSLSGPSSFCGSRSTLITVVTHLNAHLIQTHTRMDGRAQAQHCRTGWHTRVCLIVGEVDYLFLFFCAFLPRASLIVVYILFLPLVFFLGHYFFFFLFFV